MSWVVLIIGFLVIVWLGSRVDDASVAEGAKWRLLDGWYWGDWWCLAVIAGIAATAFFLLRLEA